MTARGHIGMLKTSTIYSARPTLVLSIFDAKTEPREPLSPEQLDELPFVTDVYRRHLHVHNYRQSGQLYPFVDLFTGRGCAWGRCVFCLWPHTINKGAGYRMRQVKNVIEELRFISKEMPYVKEVFFQDDVLPEERALELSSAILESGLKLRWSCYARPVLKYEALRLMRLSGCRCMHVGYESANSTILRLIRKGTTRQQMERFTTDAKKLGLYIVADFVTGLPGETKETIRETIAWAKRLPVERYTITLPKPYPCTPFYDWLAEHGCLDSRGRPSYPGLSAAEIYKYNKWSLRSVYFSPRYLLRMALRPSEWSRVLRSAYYFLPYAFKGDSSCDDRLEW